MPQRKMPSVPLIEAALDAAALDEMFSCLDHCHLPGAAVGIALEGRVIYRKGFGLASMELPIALCPTMRMRIGSTSKHFTALLWLLLCEQGRASLDDPIERYIPEIHASAHGVTIRQLLTHTSGLRDAFDVSWHFNGTGRRVRCEDLLSFYTTMADVNDTPGRGWLYNNGGYLLVTVAIERLTGRTLDEELRERIFIPAGMQQTTLRRWDSDFLPNSATLHTSGSGGRFERSYLGTEGVGQGGIASTADDMLRWLAHMDRPTVGNAATWSAMTTPQRLSNGASTEYGLGLRTSAYRGRTMISHSGGVMGGNCQMLKLPEAGLDIVIILNRSDVLGVTLAERILDACLGDREEMAPASSAIPRQGVFHSPGRHRVVELAVHDGRQSVSIDGFDLPMTPDDGGTLWPKGSTPQKNRSIAFADRSATPTRIQLEEFGDAVELVRVAEQDSSAQAPLGRYRSAGAGVGVEIVRSAHRIEMHTSGGIGSAVYDLTPLGKDLWRAKHATATFPPGGVLCFDPDGAGFHFSSFRTRGLRFERNSHSEQIR